jgi:hypothetical protein
MAKYNVIAYETTALTYEIEADSPEEALRKYNESEHPDQDFGEADEELLGVDDVRVEPIHYGGGGPPYDAATATGMYDREG